MKPREFCATAYTLSMLSGRWKFEIVHWLLQGPQRFNALQRLLGTISHPALSRALKELINSGLVQRHDRQTLPLHVEYSLTERGQSLRGVLCAMHDWASENSIPQEGEGHGS